MLIHPNSPIRIILRLVRQTLMFLLLLGSLLLWHWSATHDLRFYKFLQTRPGLFLANTFKWSNHVNLTPLDRPDADLSNEKLELRQLLEAGIKDHWPSKQLELDNGDVLLGNVLEEKAGSILFQEVFGAQGSVEVRYPRNRVAKLSPYTNTPPRVTYRDIVFQQDFPEMALFRSPPYTVVTDENLFQVEHYMQTLEKMHANFNKEFGPLITRPSRGQCIQVLFFREEEDFIGYQKQYAPRLENSAGFYSPLADRLVVFNQVTAAHTRDMKDQLIDSMDQHRRSLSSYSDKKRLDSWHSSMSRRVVRKANQQTLITLRHEGAHQLFYNYGIHSGYHAENIWLIEGLASYCETAQPADPDPFKQKLFLSASGANRLIPLELLINHRSNLGLFTFERTRETPLAYAQSWALVHFLMQAEYRDKFFDYIRLIRDPDKTAEVIGTPRHELLCQTLGLSFKQLRQRLHQHVLKL